MGPTPAALGAARSRHETADFRSVPFAVETPRNHDPRGVGSTVRREGLTSRIADGLDHSEAVLVDL